MLRIKHSGKYQNKCFYLVIRLKQDGLKKVLGMWTAESESASFPRSVLADLKALGMADFTIIKDHMLPYIAKLLMRNNLELEHLILIQSSVTAKYWEKQLEIIPKNSQ